MIMMLDQSSRHERRATELKAGRPGGRGPAAAWGLGTSSGPANETRPNLPANLAITVLLIALTRGPAARPVRDSDSGFQVPQLLRSPDARAGPGGNQPVEPESSQ